MALGSEQARALSARLRVAAASAVAAALVLLAVLYRGVTRPTLARIEEVRRAVAAFVAVGADESVQRVVTAVHRLSRRLDQWYDRQLADIDVSTGEWAVLGELARSGEDSPLTPS